MTTHGGVTQLVEYPVHTRLVTCSSQVAATRPVGQAVKTPPFHGGNMGSIPVRVTMKKRAPAFAGARFFIMICVGIEEAGPAQRGEKQSGGLFFRPWEIPRIPERSPQDCETESGFLRVTMRKRAF